MKQIFFSSFLTIFVLIIFNSCQSDNVTNTKVNIGLEEKIGQMLLAGFRGMSVDANSPIVQHIQAGKVGGIILFDYDVVNKEFIRNIESPEQVKKLISTLNQYAKTPLFTAIDQEGGKVLRLKPRNGFPNIPSAYHLGQLNNLDSTRYYAQLNAENLAKLGFNLNFTPVVDLDTLRETGVIGRYERSFSKDPGMVIKHAKVVIDAHQQAGVIPSLKHFPGHGSSKDDSHLGMTDVTDTWTETELEPYQQILNPSYGGAVMTAHVFNRNIDTEYLATLSPRAMSILRDRFNFQGVIFSDDMQMKAIASEYGLEQAIVRCINAGVDVLCFGNNLDYDEQIPEKFLSIVLKAVEQGEIKPERIEQSYQRIMALKGNLKSFPVKN